MRAAVIEHIGERFVTRDVEIADPIGHEVLVEVRASGLCHSDLSLAEHDFGMPLPMILGHEIAGIVTSIGPEVTEFSRGDHVVGSLISHCGHCDRCLSGQIWECAHAEAVRRSGEEPARLTVDGHAVFQSADLGGFAEQVLAHENNLVAIDRRVPFDRACLLGCGVITGAGAVINSAAVRVGDTVAIIGCGGVGLNAIQGARLAGARRIIAIDLVPSKLELAKAFGATDVINPSEGDPVAAVRSLTGGLGVDAAFEVIGIVPTVKQAIAMTRIGGTAYLVGMHKPDANLEINPSIDLIFGQTSVRGVYMGSSNFKRDIPLFADLYLQGRFNLDDLVSQTIGLDDINDGYDDLRAGGVARSVIVF